MKLKLLSLTLLSALSIFLIGCATDRPPEQTTDASAGENIQLMKGTPAELYQYGNRYAQGKGVTQNYKTAAAYYRASAEEGYAKAQYSLAYLYRTGRGVTRNYDLSAQWFEKAAAQGNASAQYSLGMRYLLGQGTAQDYPKAIEWFEKAAAKNNAL